MELIIHTTCVSGNLPGQGRNSIMKIDQVNRMNVGGTKDRHENTFKMESIIVCFSLFIWTMQNLGEDHLHNADVVVSIPKMCLPWRKLENIGALSGN